jgi:hypothetical protein
MAARSLVLQALERLALLLVWCLVAWGALLLVSAVGNAVGEGLRPALARLLPAPGASIWGWLNPLSVLLALLAALAFAVFALARRSTDLTRPEP